MEMKQTQIPNKPEFWFCFNCSIRVHSSEEFCSDKCQQQYFNRKFKRRTVQVTTSLSPGLYQAIKEWAIEHEVAVYNYFEQAVKDLVQKLNSGEYQKENINASRRQEMDSETVSGEGRKDFPFKSKIIGGSRKFREERFAKEINIDYSDYDQTIKEKEEN